MHPTKHTGNSLIISFFCGTMFPCAIKAIQLPEGGLGPDTESSHVTARSDLQQIQAVNVHKRDARDVTERASDAVVLRINDERTSALNAATVSHFSLSGAETMAVLNLKTKYVESCNMNRSGHRRRILSVFTRLHDVGERIR